MKTKHIVIAAIILIGGYAWYRKTNPAKPAATDEKKSEFLGLSLTKVGSKKWADKQAVKSCKIRQVLLNLKRAGLHDEKQIIAFNRTAADLQAIYDELMSHAYTVSDLCVAVPFAQKTTVIVAGDNRKWCWDSKVKLYFLCGAEAK